MNHRGIYALLLVHALAGTTGAGWDWSHPLPQGSSLRAVWVTHDQEAVAVGDCGTILHWDGWSWLPLRGPWTANLRAISGTGKGDLWVVGDGGTVLHGGGRLWEEVESGVTVDLRGVHALDPACVVAVGADGACIRWDGAAWNPSPTGTTTDLHAVWGPAGDDLWAVGSYGKVLHWDGLAWTAVSSGVNAVLRAVAGSGPEDIYALGDGANQPTLIHWDGKSWSRFPMEPSFGMSCGGDGLWLDGLGRLWIVGAGWYPHSPSISFVIRWDGAEWTTWSGGESSLYSIHGTTGAAPVAVGWDGRILRLDGDSWRPESQGDWWPVYDLHGNPADHPWALTSRYSIYAFDHRAHRWDGSRWIYEPIGTHWAEPAAIQAGSDGSVVVVGEGGQTYRRSLEGGWTEGSAPTTADLRALWEVGPGDLFALGEGGTILRGDGLDWEPWPGGGSAHIRDAWGWAADGAWAVGDGGTVLGWDGSDWTPWSSGTTRNLRAVHGLDAGLAVAVGTAGTLIWWDGSHWSPLGAPEEGDLRAVWVAGPEEVYLAGDGTWLWDGSGWQSIPVPGCGSSDAPSSLWALDDRRLMAGSSRGIYVWDGPPQPVEVRLRISDPWLTPGDELWLRAYLENPGPEELLDVPAVFLLEAYGQLYTWPSWSPYQPGALEHGLVSIPVGGTVVTVLDPLTWPDTGPDSTSDLRWYGALLSPDGTELLGEWDVLGWGFGPE